MATPEKEAAVAELTEAFSNSSAALLTDYRGLTVKQLTTLRRSLGEGSQYAVVKNTLSKIAAQGAGMPSLDHLLTGPTAIAFISGDPVEAAKALRDFAKTNPALIVKGGVLDGKELSPAEISKLADLESREVLLSNMAGALIASLSNAASLFQAPLAKAARAAGALQAKATEDPTVLRGGAGTPAPAAEGSAVDSAVDSAEDSAQEAAAPTDTASGDPVVGETTDEPVAGDEVPSMTAESKTDAAHPGEPASAVEEPATEAAPTAE